MTKETMTAKEYGALLFRERTNRGYSQHLVAKVAGVHSGYVSSAETGKYVPKDAFAKIVSASNKIFGKNIDVDTDTIPTYKSQKTSVTATTENTTPSPVTETKRMSKNEYRSYLRDTLKSQNSSPYRIAEGAGIGRSTIQNLLQTGIMGKNSLSKLVSYTNKTFGANIEIDYADDFTTTTRTKKRGARGVKKSYVATPTTTKTTTTGVSIPVTMSVNVSLNESQIEAAYNKLPETSRKTLLKRFVGNI